jgi:hypothetical protein
MTITKKDICTMYDQGMSHAVIANRLIEAGEMDDYTEAYRVVEAVILEYKRKK